MRSTLFSFVHLPPIVCTTFTTVLGREQAVGAEDYDYIASYHADQILTSPKRHRLEVLSTLWAGPHIAIAFLSYSSPSFS